MLCSACDAVRFPSAETGQAAVVRQVKSDKTKAAAKSKVAAAGGRKDTKENKDGKRYSRQEDLDSDADYCAACQQPVDHAHLVCDICKLNYHCDCTGLPEEVHDVLLNIAPVCGWVCYDCRKNYKSQFNNLSVALARTNEELAEMRVSIAALQNEMSMMKSTPTTVLTHADAIADTAAEDLHASSQVADGQPHTKQGHPVQNKTISAISIEVHKTLIDKQRRKANVIVSGLAESEGDDVVKKAADDASFRRLCEEHLSLKPSLGPKGCMRIGQLPADGDCNHKPRRLLVHLSDEKNADDLLAAAKQLRRSDDSTVSSSVFINPDLSPAEAKLAFELRQRRRELKLKRTAGHGVVPGTIQGHPTIPAVNGSDIVTSDRPVENVAASSFRSN